MSIARIDCAYTFGDDVNIYQRMAYGFAFHDKLAEGKLIKWVSDENKKLYHLSASGNQIAVVWSIQFAGASLTERIRCEKAGLNALVSKAQDDLQNAFFKLQVAE